MDRRKREEDPHLRWKMGVFFVGGALALVGIALDSTSVVGAAVVVLLAGAALRFLPRKR